MSEDDETGVVVITLLRRAAEMRPTGPAVSTRPDRSASYPDLVQAAERLAAGLQAQAIRRFGIASVDAEHVLALLGAASIVGAQACVLPPEDPSSTIATAARLDLPVVFTESELPPLPTVRTIAWLAEQGREPAHIDLPRGRPHLVLTTGSTGTPKAIRYDWNQLTKQARRAAPDKITMDQRWLLAYGLHQFGGLQVLMHVVSVAATLIAPTPRRPRAGLDAMREFAVTHASATPTYWRFLLAELRSSDGPVPDLQQVTLGGEASSPDLLDSLRTTFPGAHLTQVYAASEFGAVNVSDGLPGLPLSILDNTDADVQFQIIDGELWVRSTVGSSGVLGQPPIRSDSWRPTGDLVDIVDGRIRFRGRSTEVINVGGIKVHPLPVEERVLAVPGVQAARVFGRPNALTGMVVAVELVVAPNWHGDKVVDAVRRACHPLPAASRPRSIRTVAELATIGGKLTRRA